MKAKTMDQDLSPQGFQGRSEDDDDKVEFIVNECRTAQRSIRRKGYVAMVWKQQ